MIKNHWRSILPLLLIALLFAGNAFSGEKEGTIELVNKGHDYIKANGIEKAVQAFRTDQFKKGDLFLMRENSTIRSRTSDPSKEWTPVDTGSRESGRGGSRFRLFQSDLLSS